MKKIFFIATLIVFAVCGIYAQEPISIVLREPFHLNPITGINGDEEEASSKFVQRMIFSPLVFPLQDPYLQDDYKVAMDLSIIEERIKFYDDERRSFIDFNINRNNSVSGGQSRMFKVKVRNNLELANATRRFELSAYDVVFSYRLARVTMDRFYRTRTSDQQINTLMYAKMRSIESIYYARDDDGYIVFEIDRAISCQAFVNLLVYVPILSVRQMLRINPNQDRTLSSSLINPLRLSQLPNGISHGDYDNYDMNFLIRPGNRTVVADFYNNPMGYGQFVVSPIKDPGVVAGGDLIGDKFDNITLLRNQNWCNFSPNKSVDNTTIRHTDYTNNRLTLRISVTKNKEISGRRISGMTPDEVLYNYPVSASLFDAYRDMQNAYQQKAKRKMQISHSLYGIFFGPLRGTNTPLSFSTRNFFQEMMDRSRIENSLRHLTGNPSLANFYSSMNGTQNFASDIELQRLYLPFYVSGRGSPIAELNRELEEKDDFHINYRAHLQSAGVTDLRSYYLRKIDQLVEQEAIMATSKEIYQQYFFYKEPETPIDVLGRISSRKNAELMRLYGLARNELIRNGTVNIDIVHRSGDKIGESIASLFQSVLQKFFSDVSKSESWNFTAGNIDIKEIATYEAEWTNLRERNARDGKISLLIKGWNYKFDIQDQLRYTTVDGTTEREVARHYNQLVSGDRNLDATAIYAEVARSFVRNCAIIPVIGVQNYAISNRESFPVFEDERFRAIEILLLPYYWR